MANRIRIARVQSLPLDLDVLCVEAARQGFGFVDRLVSDWRGGANTFSQPGECLLGAFADDALAGIGGLNIDPYVARLDIGRIRHLYVRDRCRGQGIGTALLDRLLIEARKLFVEVRLRTDTEAAAVFYTCRGFSPIEDATASHRLCLGVRE